jgi:hypothetical protein
MSNTQIAFLNRANVPNREALQASIERLGFNLQLDPEFSPFDDSGFSPCTLDGTPDVGFEVHYAPASEVIDGDSDRAAIAGDRDFSMSMVWGGSMKDCACVMIVSCALATDFGAIVTYEGEPPESIEAMLENTRSIIADAAKEKPRRRAPPATVTPPPPKKPWWRFW